LHVEKRAAPRSTDLKEALADSVRQLASSLDDGQIARILNMQKRPTLMGLLWTKDRVRDFRRQHRILSGTRPKGEDVLTASQAADYLGIGRHGLLGLVERGAITPNQVTPFAPWNVARTELDSQNVRELVRVLKVKGRLPERGCPENQKKLFPESSKTYERSKRRSIVSYRSTPLAGRTPKLKRRLSGEPLKRRAERANEAEPLKQPPRMTRYSCSEDDAFRSPSAGFTGRS
jgi:hypothetical protein